jgi:sterol 3beta-glucosyltransferase
LDYGRLSDDLVALVETPAGRDAIAAAGGAIEGIRALVDLVGRSVEIQRDLFRDGWAAAREADPDLIVYHPKMTIALHYAERLGVPAVMASLFPTFLSTGAYPNPGLPRLRLGDSLTAAYNRATHRPILAVIRVACRWLFAPWRRAHGLPRQPRGTGVIHRPDGTRVLILNAWSLRVAPDARLARLRRADDRLLVLDRAGDWTPPPALEAFPADGPPPVYVGFGSMAGRNPARTTRLVLDALRRAGCRGVLARGWGGLKASALPASVYLLDRVPHGWLFPRVAAVVHHGGAGTTAAGPRAGRPTVVCPFFGDQPFWGRRVHELGAGPAPIPQKNLTAERLAHALRAATGRPSMRKAAAELGARIRREDGTIVATAFIERVVLRALAQRVTSPRNGQRIRRALAFWRHPSDSPPNDWDRLRLRASRPDRPDRNHLSLRAAMFSSSQKALVVTGWMVVGLSSLRPSQPRQLRGASFDGRVHR